MANIYVPWVFEDIVFINFLNYCCFHAGNLKLIAEYFQSTETYGGPTRDWIGIYEGCRRQVVSTLMFVASAFINDDKEI